MTAATIMPESGNAVAPMKLALLPHEPEGDARVCLTPQDTAVLTADGHRLAVPNNPSIDPAFSVNAFTDGGASFTDDVATAAECLLTLHPPSETLIARLDARHTLVGFLAPFERPEVIASLAEKGLTAVALELVPRTTIAQSMDALSSQASLAGYAAVMLAASRLAKALPMMSTAAGTIRPAKVLVLGAGVAGLQAIATAQRLGARVTAFDVRATAAEQVRSLGAKFASLPEAEDAETAGGYAKEASQAQLERQREHLKGLCSASDIVITTAQVFGRPAPTLVTEAMVDAMQPGSIIVDAAASTGGNVEIGRPDEDLVRNGVTVISDTILAARVARDASQVLSANIVALLKRIIDPTTARVKAEGEDEIADAVTVVRDGRITDERVAAQINQQGSST
ncbi:MAG: NAD(P) transhydrogenase subunit alpha [Planctomycetota bacterium]